MHLLAVTMFNLTLYPLFYYYIFIRLQIGPSMSNSQQVSGSWLLQGSFHCSDIVEFNDLFCLFYSKFPSVNAWLQFFAKTRSFQIFSQYFGVRTVLPVSSWLHCKFIVNFVMVEISGVDVPSKMEDEVCLRGGAIMPTIWLKPCFSGLL